MKNSLRILLSFLIISTLFFTVSCDEDLSKIDTKPAESALQVLKIFSDIILLVDDGMIPDSAKSGMRITGESYTETITGDYPNKLYTWDFGPDGDYQGIIRLLLSDEYTNPGASIQVSFENFIYKGKPVQGTASVKYIGKNSHDDDEYDLGLDQVKVGDHKLSATWKLKRTENGMTPDQTDDLFTLTQPEQTPAQGMTSEGVEFTLNIIQDLVFDLSCEYIITQGIFEIKTTTTTLTADFGTGECDNLVKTSNGVIKADLFL